MASSEFRTYLVIIGKEGTDIDTVKDKHALRKSCLDRNEGTESNALVNNAQLKNHFPSVNDYAPKARKPYTISKQREKWTEEEHTKFIDAVKLYGRSWRCIEEHVGTKTAVQIRSHAQKFFSKVVRESNTDDASPVKPIEIPPPRPKRKPSHPYPRKLVASSKAKPLVGEQPRRSPSPYSSNSGQDNQSPTSVFCAPGSEMFDTTEPNTPNGSQSPVSSANIVNTGCFSTSEPNSSPMGTEPQLLDQLTDSSDPDEPVPMKLELFPQESILEREENNEAPTLLSLKLFGKTVLVSNSHRTLSSTKVTNKMINETSMCSLSRNPNSTDFSSLPSSLTQEDITYQLHIPIPTKVNSFLITSEKEVTINWEIEREFFRLSPSNEENNPQSKLVFVHNDEASSSGQRACPKTSPRGFVPYKRCLAERETQLSTMANEEREEQRIRLCL